MKLAKTRIIILAILFILALTVSACQSAATATSTPTAAVTQALEQTAYPQPYPLATSDPYLAPAEQNPSAYPVPGAQSASLYPGIQDGTEVMWEQAVSVIMNDEVAQVMQTHELKVYLTLKDGRTLVTVEPEIDEVNRIIKDCGAPCKDILIATE